MAWLQSLSAQVSTHIFGTLGISATSGLAIGLAAAYTAAFSLSNQAFAEVEKVFKLILIIIGFLAGMFFIGVQLLQKYGYVSTVDWDKLGNDTSTQIQHWAANADITNVHSLFHTLGIPVSRSQKDWHGI
jgi:uncharacterized membrane protein (Fun14 family)